jgi:acetylornithine/N-succinyldiaminopimelate aminotransferase
MDGTMSTAVMPTYARQDIAFASGEGVYLTATDGKRYLDFCAGIAVDALGHCHPKLVEVLQAQAGRIWHTSNLYRIPEQERLAERLVATSFAEQVFFCNSGAEAVEGGIKLCRKYHSANGNPEKWRILTFDGSFHGRTLATLSAAKNEKHTAGFGPETDGFDIVPFGNLNALRAAVTDETAAILVEPIQGEGGIRPADPDFLRDIRAVADEFGLLVFYDEVQTGMGRTGKLWAHEWAGVAPDVMSAAKGLGGGFPIGAVMATAEAAKGMTAGTHGSTFGGNHLAAAVADAVLETITEPGFLAHVCETGELLRREVAKLCKKHPGVFTGVRGAGLMLGIECVPANLDLMDMTREEGLLTVVAGDNILRLVPPLIIDATHVAEAVAILDKVATRVEQESAA